MPSPLSSVRAVLFDAVGTLIHADPPVIEAYHEAGRRCGSALSRSEIAARFAAAFRRHHAAQHSSEQAEQTRWRRVVADVFTDVDDTGPLFDELWSHFADHRHWAVYDDVKEAWTALRSSGYRVGVASNFDQRLPDMAQGLAPLDEAEAIFVSSQLGFAKPHGEFFRGIEAALSLSPPQLLLVGDDPEKDWHGAKAAGWHALLIDRNGANGEALVSLRELPPLLG